MSENTATITDKLHIDALKSHFKDTVVFDNKDVAKFYANVEGGLKQTTVNWRIYHLVQKGILKRIGRGKFTLGEGRSYFPEIPRKLKSVYSKLKKGYPYLEICVWDTSILNEFMVHQPFRFYYMVEVEKDATESVFFFLKESGFAVFHQPEKDLLDKYLPEGKQVYIVKPLVSEAPLQEVDAVKTVTLEKMLVDIFSDETIFAAQQGAEMRNIFREAFTKYTVNRSRMLRYADRKRKKEDMLRYLGTFSINVSPN